MLTLETFINIFGTFLFADIITWRQILYAENLQKYIASKCKSLCIFKIYLYYWSNFHERSIKPKPFQLKPSITPIYKQYISIDKYILQKFSKNIFSKVMGGLAFRMPLLGVRNFPSRLSKDFFLSNFQHNLDNRILITTALYFLLYLTYFLTK